MKAAIIGTTGYGGIELLRILHTHPEIQIQSIHSTTKETAIWEEYPHLYSVMDKKLELIDPEKIADSADILFFATPSGVSTKLMAGFQDAPLKIVDLSGDMRLQDSKAYEKWYKKQPAPPQVIQQFVYGLTEWNKAAIASAKWIANPGCYPTAALLGLAPLATCELLEPASIIIDAKSGVSGAGRTPARATMHSELTENFTIYKVNKHQHTPEIEQQLLIWNKAVKPITFSTQLIPIARGIMATIYVQLSKEISTSEVVQLYKEAYKEKPFVRIRPEGHFPSVKEVTGSNYCDIGIDVDERTGRATIVSVIDNLMKGAAGQAVQNANLMFGLEEDCGLRYIPLYP
ncbi:N-acetyl-gamma-glutamyl-phosphate reductase [Bacillaceae bacterium Marseille-Q3522]|nr:N-acetyl-gamma-glutamyl-phosphate reductase [Bacillaceae bacterium Marseille-Q3522]